MKKWKLIQSTKLFLRSYHPIVHSLLLGTILARAASSMSMPFLAIYLSKNTDMSPLLIGLIIGAGSLAGTAGGFFGGALSDQIGRRRVLLGALIGWGFVFLGFSITSQPVFLFLLSLLNGLCRSFYEPVSQALMADLTPKENRMKVFSLRYLMINIGVSVGPLLGALFANIDSSLPFMLTGIIYLVYAAILYGLLNQFGIRSIEGEKKSDVTFSSAWNVVRNDIVLRYYLFGNIIGAISYSQMTVTLSQYVGGSFPDGVALFALMMSVNAITVVVLQLPLGRWAAKRTPMRVLTVGVILYAIGNIGFGLSFNSYTFLGSMVVFTLGEILTFPSTNMLIDRIAPEGMRGTYYGAQSFSNLGHFAGPWIGGLVLGYLGGGPLFMLMSAVALGTAGFYRIGERVRENLVVRATGQPKQTEVSLH